jgi:hypothetical protein
VLLAGSTALAIIAFVVGTVSFVNLLDARTEIISRIDPAQVTERDLLASLSPPTSRSSCRMCRVSAAPTLPLPGSGPSSGIRRR